jgi:hypothetical protein
MIQRTRRKQQQPTQWEDQPGTCILEHEEFGGLTA